jgi:hypothetical protein
MPEDIYQVISRSGGGWTVMCNDIPVRHSPRRELMERYAKNPAWRLALAYDSMQAEKMALARRASIEL